MITPKLKIGYALYDIVEEHHPVDQDNILCRGTIAWQEQQITLDPGWKPRPKLQTFFHEMTHGINEHYGVKLTEDQTEQYSQGLTQVVLDNFDLLMTFIKPALEK